EHARAGPAHCYRGGRARRAPRLHREPVPRGRLSGGPLPRPGPRGDPGRGPGGRPLHRLHAPALRPLRHALDPLHRVPHEGDAGGLRAVGRDLSRHPARSGRRRPHPGGGAPAGARRHHRSPRPQRRDRGVVLHLHRRDPRALRIHHPVHPEHQGDVGGALRLEGRGPVRRHRGAGPAHARADLRHRHARAGGAGARRAGRARLMPGITLRGLVKRYGDFAALEDLSLEVRAGELVSLLGPSGCGKTTTLRLVAGFLKPEAGEIRVGDRLLSSPAAVVPPERRRMAMIFQSYALWPHMTVAQNVGYGLRFKGGVSRADRGRRVTAMLKVVRLDGLEHRYPGELSGGQQQRVAVARALVVEPEVLLLDEPLSNLDANLREEMRFEIRRLHEAFGITTLYVTHDQAEAMVISDRIAVLERGRVAQIGTADELFHRPRTRFVAEFIGKTNVLDGKAVAPD